jgi:hypothetical protein
MVNYLDSVRTAIQAWDGWEEHIGGEG